LKTLHSRRSCRSRCQVLRRTRCIKVSSSGSNASRTIHQIHHTRSPGRGKIGVRASRAATPASTSGQPPNLVSCMATRSVGRCSPSGDIWNRLHRRNRSP
jgi:hypothetical protein